VAVEAQAAQRGVSRGAACPYCNQPVPYRYVTPLGLTVVVVWEIKCARSVNRTNSLKALREKCLPPLPRRAPACRRAIRCHQSCHRCAVQAPGQRRGRGGEGRHAEAPAGVSAEGV